MTEAFFIRHGVTQENVDNRIQGQQPGTLLVRDTELYLAAVTPLLREKNPQVLLSSDLKRAVESRRILKEFLQISGIEETTSPLLREKGMGFYEGMLWEEVPGEFREQRDREIYNFRQFGGESDDDVQGRVQGFLRWLGMNYPNKRVACVTHAGWIKQLVRLADKEGVMPDKWTDRTAIYHASIDQYGKLLDLHAREIVAQLPGGRD